RHITWTIIGKPAMSASGLPGSRLAAMRAGMRTRTSFPTMDFAALPERMSHTSRCLYGLPGARQTGYLCDALNPPGVEPARLITLSLSRCGSKSAMDSFELNKILGAFLFTCLMLVALSITAGAIFNPELPAKPGYNIAVQETKTSAPAAAAPEEPIEKL